MIRLLIFDLDLCLWDPFTALVKKGAFLNILGVIEKKLGKEKKDRVRKELFKWGLPGIIRRHHLPAAVARQITSMYVVPTVSFAIARTYPDVPLLATLKQKKILVTTGLPNLQNSKIKALHLDRYFDEIVINNMEGKRYRWTKKRVFRRILARYRLRPSEVAVIGDRPYDELQPAKELGLITIQSLRPRVQKAEGFDFYITTFKELPRILRKVR